MICLEDSEGVLGGIFTYSSLEHTAEENTDDDFKSEESYRVFYEVYILILL